MTTRRPKAETLKTLYPMSTIIDNMELATQLGFTEDAALFREVAKLQYVEGRDRQFADILQIEDQEGPAYDKFKLREEQTQQLKAAFEAAATPPVDNSQKN